MIFTFAKNVHFFSIAYFGESWYNYHAAAHQSGNRLEVRTLLEVIISFLATVAVGVFSSILAHYICKWLDHRDNKGQ